MAPDRLPDPARSAALLIGAGRFTDPGLPPLEAVANNVDDLHATFTDPALWGLSAERCLRVHDPRTAEDVLEPLDRLSRAVEDTLVVYYAGHGLVLPDGDLLLATSSTAVQRPRFSGLPYSAVRELVGRSRKALRRIVILDCCFSGRALGVMADTATLLRGQLDVEGTYVLASSPANVPSLAPEGHRHTLFTGGLLQIIRSGIPEADEWLSLDDIYFHIRHVMVRGQWPDPQRLATNSIGRLRLLRNQSWGRSAPSPAPVVPERERSARPGMDGVRQAIAVITPTFGDPGQDALAAVHGAFAGDLADPGASWVLETMQVMRTHYGDGAATAAILLGSLLEGLNAAVAAGEDPHTLDVGLEAEAARLLRTLDEVPVTELPGSTRDLAVHAAVGDERPTELVLRAVEAVGPRNVQVSATAAETKPFGHFTFKTEVLSPNMLTHPVTLERPLVVVSVDGEVDPRLFGRQQREGRRPVLLISPAIGVTSARSLVRMFSELVAVRPAIGAVDLDLIRAGFPDHNATTGWGEAQRALVLHDTTTVEKVELSLDGSLTRVTVSVPDQQPADQRAASRALAVARSVEDGGVVASGAEALHWAAVTCATRTPTDRTVAQLLGEAAREPERLLAQNLRNLPARTGVTAVVPLATLRGAVSQAVATAARFLAQE